jgi:subfamily B ATP-binding cassette protein MsbA
MRENPLLSVSDSGLAVRGAGWSLLFHHAWRYRALLAVGALLLLTVGLFEGMLTLSIGPVFDRVLSPKALHTDLVLVKIPHFDKTIYLRQFVPGYFRNVWTVFAFFFVSMTVYKAVMQFAGGYMINFAGQAAVMDLRNRVYEKIIRQPLRFFQDNPTGKLMSAIVSDIEKIQYVVSQAVADFVRFISTAIVLYAVMLALNWKMALGALCLVPFVLYPSVNIGKLIRRSSRKSQENVGEMSRILQETISGSRVVKAFGMEKFEIDKFREATRRLLKSNMRWVRAHIMSPPLMEVLGAIAIVFVLLYARNEIQRGLMTTGLFAAFVVAMFKLYEPIKGLSSIYNMYQQAVGAASFVTEYLSLGEEVQERPGAPALPPFQHSIQFESVSFSYDSGSPILKDIELTVQAGEVVAIVGLSGAGKSTLVNLLPRFYDVTEGRLLIDGRDVRDVTLNSLRSQIALVTQETILFHDTVRKNISYGLENKSDEEVIAAAKAALANDFIRDLPDGYQTVIGERGMRFSGGQRQRLAIARALLKDSRILILDEATSELDSESELAVQRAIANLIQGRTTFVIAHRLSTIRRADKIVVLEDGRIQEIGTHQDLLARGGLYQRLYEMQFAESEPGVEATTL